MSVRWNESECAAPITTMPISTPSKITVIQTILSFIGIGAAFVHVSHPELAVDSVTFGFLLIAVLPWLAPLIKAAELPGGIKIEFQDVQAAADKITLGSSSQLDHKEQPEAAYLSIVDQDPNLALTGLRIEIEKRLRELAPIVGLPKSRPLSQLIRDLQTESVLSSEQSRGLLELVSLGNQAAHGVEVSPSAAYSAIQSGPQVLSVIDSVLKANTETQHVP
jgi:hypothetical protein